MIQLTENNLKVIESKIKAFRTAWNNNDLGALRSYLSKNIVCKHPGVHIGFVNMLRGSHSGYFAVLKFWEKIFTDFNASVDKVEINKIESIDSGYKVHCMGHYPYMELSGNFFVLLDADFLIERLEFTRVTDYRADLKISSLGLAVKYLKIKLEGKGLHAS